MKASVTFTIAKEERVLVSVGDEIDPHTPVFAHLRQAKIEVIPVAGILQVKEGSITKYLKKSVGSQITEGEVLAEKKGLLSTSVIKSPSKGTIKELDLKKGTVTVVCAQEKSDKIVLPIRGKISKITPHHLEIETEGKSFRGESGVGKEVIGDLLFFDGAKIGVLDIRDDVEESVVVCRVFLPETVAKLEVLGAVGLISGKKVPETDLPYVVVTDEILDHLKIAVSKKIWIRPMEKQIIVLD